MTAAQITIGVTKAQDGNYGMGLNFVGDEECLIPLLGAITHASLWVNNRITKRVGEGSWGNVDGITAAPAAEKVVALPEKQSNEYSNEQELSRDKAIEATLYTIEVLQMRVDKMRKSPENATFSINPDFLNKL